MMSAKNLILSMETIVVLMICQVSFICAEDQTHLFILSGQSNMARLKPELSFTPTVKKYFATDDVIVVKDAKGGQPIRRWDKQWKAAGGEGPKADGALYDSLMDQVKKAVEGKELSTVTFIWMQGERDAREKHGSVYHDSLQRLIKQVQTDLGRDQINFVIGRLSDYNVGGQQQANDWDVVREAQVKLAEGSTHGKWIDTDDLNGPKDGLHYTADGYRLLGERFARAGIELIEAGK